MMLFQPGQIVELRCPHFKGHTASGYFSDFAKLWTAAQEFSGKIPGVYVTLNPVHSSLLARACNRVKVAAKSTTNDTDILCRRWLPIDLDVMRAADISSTESEHQAALVRAQEVRQQLRTQSWPEPILADSGNGAHLLYRIDLPNDEQATRTVQNCLKVLSMQYGDTQIGIDIATYNASRIWKCYGTLACKGDSTEDRPHRQAKMLEAPEELHPVPPELLFSLAGTLPETPALVSSNHGERFELAAWITAHHLPVAFEGKWDGAGRKWILDTCPWNTAHINRAAYILQFSNGAIAAGCRHNGCAGQNWTSLRKLLEPGWEPYNSFPGPAKQIPIPAVQPPRKSSFMPTDILRPKALCQSYTDFIQSLAASRILLGWTELDNTIRGITPGEVLTLIAQTGAGKTAWMQNMLRHVAYYRRVVSLWCSMEQPAHQCLERYAQLITGKSGSEIEYQWGIDGQREKLIAKIVDELGDNTLTCTVPGLTLEEIEEAVEVAEQQLGNPVNLLAIDYAGLIDGRELDRTLYGQMSQIARQIKTLAKRRNLAVCWLVQVSRNAGEDASVPLNIHAGRDTGAIEEATDFLLGLYRPDLHLDDRRVTIQVLKNRKGRANVEFSYSFNHDSLEIGRTALNGKPFAAEPPNEHPQREEVENDVLDRSVSFPQ